VVMKDITPRELAFRVALLAASSIAILLAIFERIFEGRWSVLPLFVFLSGFAIIYFSFYYGVQQFIYSKIQLIYKTIHNLKRTKNVTKRIFMDKDIISNVRQEVLDWAKDNKQEIERLEGLEKYRREFIGNVSHELKTPIFNIQGYLLTLLEGGLEDPTINRRYLDRAEKSVQRMISIVEDLDIITKLEMGKLELQLKRVDVLEIAKEAIESQEMRAKNQKTRVIIEEVHEKPIWVKADGPKILQVLINLLVNSINYNDENGLTEIRFFDMGENVLVEVADNGIGIEKEHLPRLFERFYRVDKSRSRAEGGSGLGLAIVKHIMEAHDQTINVRSTPGEGSTFSFTLKKA
jgi:two-component system phosphate regulon sensor histidine kinase PhoR